MHGFRYGAVAMLLVLGLGAPLEAQRPAAIRDGRRALSFGMFTGGGGMVGLSLMATSRTAFTLDLQANGHLQVEDRDIGGTVTDERDLYDVSVAVAPGFRRYMAGRGSVASYVAGRALLGFAAQAHEERTPTSTSTITRLTPMGGAALGFGLEWFPTDNMSLRGEAALSGTYAYRQEERTGGIEVTTHSVRVGFDQSALVFSIWF